MSSNDLTLGSIATIIDCEHKTAPETENEIYAFSVGTRALTNNTIDVNSCKPVDEQTYKLWSRRGEVEEGDIILAREAPVGGVGLVKSLSPKYCLGQRTVLIKPKTDVVNSYYLNYLLQSDAVQGWFTDMSTGSTVLHLNVGDIKKLPIPNLPSMQQQQRIAEILNNLEAKINLNKTIAGSLEDMAQEIFKSWFIDFDPVKAKMAGEKPASLDEETAALFPDSMEETELGLIPKGWKSGQLNSVLKLHKSTVKAGAATESVPYVPVDQIGAKDFFLKNSMPGTEAKTSLVSFKKNDILFGAMRAYFHKVVLAPFDGTTRTTTFVLRAVNHAYLAYSLLCVFQEQAVAYATNNSQGTTIPYAVWSNSFENYPIVLPTENIAKAFNNLILPMIEYGYSLISENQDLAQIRDILLPRLMSGELQIPEDKLAS